MAKSKYHTHVEPRLIEVEGWARDGLTDEQIAKNLGIAYSTFREYVKQFSALSAPLKRGKEVVDREVENALLKRALGYKYEEVTKELVIDPETGEKTLQPVKVVTKEVVPDTTAQIFWLKNRMPEMWRDKKDIEHSGEVNSNMTIQEIDEQIAKLEKMLGAENNG